jgi:hypothetical protein
MDGKPTHEQAHFTFRSTTYAEKPVYVRHAIGSPKTTS